VTGDILFSSECDREWLNQLNNSGTFSGQPIGFEEFLVQRNVSCNCINKDKEKIND